MEMLSSLDGDGKEAEPKLEIRDLRCTLTPMLYDLPLYQVQGDFQNKEECLGSSRACHPDRGNKTSICTLCQFSIGHQQQSTKSHEDQEEGDLVADSESVAKVESDSENEGSKTS